MSFHDEVMPFHSTRIDLASTERERDGPDDEGTGEVYFRRPRLGIATAKSRCAIPSGA